MIWNDSETQFIINFEFFGFLRSINCIIERNLRLFGVEGFQLSGSCSFSLYLFSKSDLLGWILFGSCLYGNFVSRFWCLDFLGRLLFMYGSFCNYLWLLCDCFLSLRLNLGLMHLLCIMSNLLCCWCFNFNVISNFLFQITVILFQCFFQSISSFKSFLSLLQNLLCFIGSLIFFGWFVFILFTLFF